MDPREGKPWLKPREDELDAKKLYQSNSMGSR
jgi:hypothetical protein